MGIDELTRRLRAHDFGFHYLEDPHRWRRAAEEHEALLAAAKAGPDVYRVLFDAAWCLAYGPTVRSVPMRSPFGSFHLPASSREASAGP